MLAGIGHCGLPRLAEVDPSGFFQPKYNLCGLVSNRMVGSNVP